MCWDISEGICILVRKGRRGIHPGANVGIDLLLWLSFLVVTVLLALGFGLSSGFSSIYGGLYIRSFSYVYDSLPSQPDVGLAATLV
jgi:hypothetical protein